MISIAGNKNLKKKGEAANPPAVTSSGNDVPKATKVAAITPGLKPLFHVSPNRHPTTSLRLPMVTLAARMP
jgi:hypothetical protein